MPTDAKCGLAVGLGIVLAVALLYFRSDPPPAQAPASRTTPAAAVQPPAVSPKAATP
jgi:hypothetical protein